MPHPYKSAPDHSFWERSVARGYDPALVFRRDTPLIEKGEAVASAGSCFAANLVPYLKKAGIRYVWTEKPHPVFQSIHQENFSYHKFSAAYGNIYTVRHLLQLVQRALGLFTPKEDRWYHDGRVIDPYRPGLAFPALSDDEFDALTAQHLRCVLNAIEQTDVFIFTLGLTEAWVSALDGAVFPSCPGTVAGRFDPNLHRFHNFSVAEIVADLDAVFTLIRSIKRRIRFVVTVSPVPLVATATPDHVLSATVYSKSVLRVAAQEITGRMTECVYFPAYEIVTGPQAPDTFFEPNRRDVTGQAVDTVMAAFLANCAVSRKAGITPHAPAERPAAPAPLDAPPADSGGDSSFAQELSATIADVECEEAASMV